MNEEELDALFNDRSEEELDALLMPLLSLPAKEGLQALEKCLDDRTSWFDVQDWCYGVLDEIREGKRDADREEVCRLLGHARDLGPPPHDYRCASSNCMGCG